MAAGFFIVKAYGIISTPDIQCSKSHAITTPQPQNPTTARDFFDLGNYYYDSGKCEQAISAYGSAIDKDPMVPEYFNNRAYTFMRMRDYKDALADLNTALSLNPSYVEALMNRGDIYNYYYAIDHQKAISDYNRVIAIGKDKDKSGSVCGHKAMAKTNNMIPLALMQVITHTDCQN